MKKYEEIMDKLEVTEEMKSRILRNLQDMISSTPMAFAASNARPRRYLYRRYIAAAAGIAVLLAGMLAVPRLLGRDIQEEPPLEGLPFMGIEEKASAQELSEAVGFAVTDISILPFEVSRCIYQSYSGEIAEISYFGDNGQELVYRKGAGDSDISGDYNVYSAEKEVVAEGRKAVLKGDGKKYNLAVWTYGRFSYSIYCENGLSEKELIAIIAESD